MRSQNSICRSMMVASAFAGVDSQSEQQLVKNIVLVHGAFGRRYHWGKVIPILEARRFPCRRRAKPADFLSADDVTAPSPIMALKTGRLSGRHSGVVRLSHRPVMIRRSLDSSLC